MTLWKPTVANALQKSVQAKTVKLDSQPEPCLSVALRPGAEAVVLAFIRKALLPAAVVGALASSYSYGHHNGSAVVQAKLDSYQAMVAQSNARAQTELTAKFQTVLQDRENNLQALRTERDALLVSLRNRKPRPEQSSSSSTSSGSNVAGAISITGCSPRELYREDAEAFAEVATDAEEVRQELLSTRAAYENARAALRNFSNNQSRPAEQGF